MKKITLMCGMLLAFICLKANAQTPPANDNLANATALQMGASCTNDFFTNIGATAETNEPVASCFTGAAHTVWFSFTAPASGAVQISTDILPGNIGDTQIALYPSPTNPNDLSTLPAEVGCDQDGGTIVSSGGGSYLSILEVGGLTAGSTYYIQVDGWNGTTGDFCIQVDAVTCPNPSNLTISNVTDNSAEISWTENGSATIWDIELGPAGFTPTGTPTANDVSNPYTATMLAKNTFYEVYLRSDCGGGDVSEWIGPVGFTTICAGLPYIESFSSGVFPDCWTRSSINNVTVEASCGPRNGVLHLQDDAEAVSVSLDATMATRDLKVSYIIGAEVCGAHPDDIFVVEYWDGASWIVAKSYDPTVSGSPFLQAYINDSFTVPMSVLTADFKLRFNSNDNSSGDDWSIDDLIVQEVPTCLVPSNLVATNITATSADLSWTDNNAPPAALWDVEIVLAGTPPTGTPTASGLTSPSYSATSLTASTAYDFYVRADCGNGDFSIWAGPFTFTTDCLTYALPYFEDFSSGVFPACWTTTDPTNSNVVATCGSRTNVLQMGDAVDVTTGFIDGTTATNGLRVSYVIGEDVCGGPAEDIVEVEYWDGVAWVVAKSYDPVFGAPFDQAYISDSFLVPQSDVTANFQVRFDIDETQSADNWSIDDLLVENAPTCLPPTNLTATSITDNSAELGWTESNLTPATTWDVEIVLAGTPSTGTPTATGVSNPYTAPGLTPATSYDFYVRADCGGGDLSSYAGPFTFSTDCLAETLPYFEDFSSGIFPVCWTTTDAANSIVVPTCGSRTNVLQVGDAVDVTTGVIDGTTATNGLKVSYVIGEDVCGGPAEDIVEVEYWDGSAWIVAKSYDPVPGTPFDQAYINDYFFVPQSDVTANFQVRFDIDETQSLDNWSIDDLKVENGPTCLPPTNLTAINITVNSAELGWTESNSTPATSWDVEIVIAGTPPSGTPTATGVSNPYNAMGLSPSTAYEFYVRADCGGGDFSDWAGPFLFYTLCAPVNFFSEDFDLVPNGQIPNCWSSLISSTSSSPFVEVQSFNSFSPPKNLNFSNGFTSSGDIFGIPPELADLPAGTHQLRFHARADANSTLEVGTMTDPTDETTYTSVQTIMVTSTYQEFIVPFTATTTDTYVAFKTSFSGFFGGVNIDDVFWETIPTCSKPNMLTVTGITPNSAVLGWTDNAGASLWDVEIVLAGNPPTGTPTATGVPNPYSATGLNAATDYEFYVRADCGNGDVSIYEGPLAFTTDCGVVFAPISEDFVSGSTPFCWIEGGITPWTYSLGADFAASAAGDHTPGGGTNYAWMDGSDNEDGEASTLTSYPVDISGLAQPALEFYLFSNNTNDSAINIVEVEIFDGLNFYKVLHLATLLGPNWEHYLIDLSGYSFAGPIQVIFTVTGNAEGGDTQHNDILLDDVAFIESTCPDPTNITFGNIDFTSVDVSWTPGGTETEWEVEYGPAGFNPGTGTVIIDNDGTPMTSLTNLTPGTAYDVYVSAVCSPDTSSQSFPASFTTNLDCPGITNFAVVAGATSIDLTWTPGGTETAWIIEFGPAGFTPGTGTIVVDNDGTAGEFIIGLIPDTDYDVYVTPICGGKNGDLFGPTTLHTPNLGIDEVAFEGFAFFPNPVKNRLSLQATGEIEKVGIYNLLGQRVLVARPESPTFEMDLGGLQTGTYLMKVRIGGSQAVYKLIKE